ncbi:MAG: hypothetical protein FJ267_09735 [Planctomycetes bacterium]|nr:hypothetical protein [Planctomycetota bacterium]
MPSRQDTTADELFEIELLNRKLSFSITSDGLYEIQVRDVTATVSLENIRRNFQQTNDAGVIARFVQQLNDDVFNSVPEWEYAKSGVRFSIEPSDYESGLDCTLHELVTDDLVKVFVFTPPDGSKIVWITESMLAGWRITRETVVKQANENMNKLVSDTQLVIEEINGVKLGMISTHETPFKASLILAERFRELVSPTHGWPVYVVVPTRDFVYVIPQKDRDFLGRLGAVVLQEYNESAHPVTADVLEVGNSGVTAKGSFAPRSR